MTSQSLPEVLKRIHRGRLNGLLALVLGILLCIPPAPARGQEPTPPPESQEEAPAPESQEEELPAAEEPEEEEPTFEEEITVTGTRVEGRSATETPAPVDIIDAETIKSTGATETGKILQLLEPSFNFSSTTISDGTDIIRPATLRALGPDQVLVLVNGKRRHQQSLLNVQQTIARGSAGYEINTIPASAIERIDVLRDGAAAQYGSDAIAGVINIGLKRRRQLELVAAMGEYTRGDGENYFHGGMQNRLGDASAYDRRGIDPPCGQSTHIPARNSAAMYPDGFAPRIGTELKDRTVTAGGRTSVYGWGADLSAT